MNIDPRYCATFDPEGNFYCNAGALQVGDTVPLRIRVQNEASYEVFGDENFVPGELVGGSRLQAPRAAPPRRAAS